MANVIKCQYCGKVAREKSRTSDVPGFVLISLECGHTITRDALKHEDYAEMVSSDGRSPYAFQSETADFAEQANLNYICGHEMGLGKTVIMDLILKRHLPQVKPVLLCCKSGLRMQHWLELYRWAGILAQIISSSREKPDFDMFDVFIISFDTLRLVRPVKSKLDEQLDEVLPEEEDSNLQIMRGLKAKRGSNAKKWDDEICSRFKYIMIDETQQIKNPASARTKSLKDIVDAASKKERVRIAGYSGTNIKNRPSEFWTMLNMVEPTLFPYYDQYCRQHIKYSQETGKEVGLRDPEGFHRLISKFFIRKTRAEALPELPLINRMFQRADMDGNFMETYKRAVKEFQQFMDIQEKSPSAMDLLGWFSRMRAITGLAKVNEAVEFVEEFLLSNDRKLVIFLHHKETAAALMDKLTRIMAEGAWEPPLLLHSGLDMHQRHEVLEQFKNGNERIMIASQLAAGEGLNMQFCSDCLMMERQWNPANEEQCEARFPRPGQTAQVINVWYLIADGTIDEFLTELVEEKRRILRQVLDGRETDIMEQGSLLFELAELLRAKGLKKFMDDKGGKKKAS